MPQLIRLFYVSRATQKGVDQVITDILRVAREFNASNGITGILTFDGEHFTQVLEGSRAGVNALMTRITRDDRHKDVRVLSSEPIHDRYFQQWAMNYIYDIRLVEEVSQYFGIIRPEADEVIEFIEDLREYALRLG